MNTGNSPPEGQLAILGLPATEDSVLTATLGTATDADNPGGIITGPISYVWQMEEDPGPGIFVDILRAERIRRGCGRIRADFHASATTRSAC